MVELLFILEPIVVNPELIILDEPTNYLDRDSLGALADAIEVYEGGVIMITHNDAFCRKLCPERWVLEKGLLNTEGDIEWMEKVAKQVLKGRLENIDKAGLKDALNAL